MDDFYFLLFCAFTKCSIINIYQLYKNNSFKKFCPFIQNPIFVETVFNCTQIFIFAASSLIGLISAEQMIVMNGLPAYHQQGMTEDKHNFCHFSREQQMISSSSYSLCASQPTGVTCQQYSLSSKQSSCSVFIV